MKTEVKIHQPTPQTRLPAHEQAARQRRAAVVGLPRSQRPPKPPAHPVGARKTWHVAWPDPTPTGTNH